MKINGISEFQSLEPRQMMAVTPLGSAVIAFGDGQQLKLFGTQKNDSIFVQYDGNAYQVSSDTGFSQSFSGNYNSIRILGGNGNDRIRVDATVDIPAYLHGGNGNDTLCGGNGDDYIYGDAGNDRLYGNGGNDNLITLGGGNRDMASGNDGVDSFWMDMSSREKIIDPSAAEWKTGAVNRVRGFETSRSTNGSGNQTVSNELVGQKIDDPTMTSGAYVYKSFANRPLFASTGPSAEDVTQGQIGNCYFLATLAGAADVSPDAIRTMITDLGDGTYAVRFNIAGGQSKFYRVDNDLPVYNINSDSPAYAKLGTEDSMWVAIAEKAFTYHRRGEGTYASINGGWMSEALTAIGAKSQQSKWRDQSGGAAAFMSWVENELADGKIVTLGVLNYDGPLNIVEGHAYTVDGVETMPDGSKQLVIRNPWGMDGYRTDDGANDGYLRLTQAETYSAINVFVSGRAA